MSSVSASYLGHRLEIGDHHVLVRPPVGGLAVRVASVPAARRLIRQLRRAERDAR